MPLSQNYKERVQRFSFLAQHHFKGTLSGLRQFSTAESALKMMKNAFYFTSKALFILKIFKFFYLTF